MINPKDEFLHEHKKDDEWMESYNFNIVDKKNKVFGFADINHYPKKRKTEFSWNLFVNEKLFSYNNFCKTDLNSGSKILTDKKFKYKIASPMESFELQLKNESMTASLNINGSYPIFLFPTTLTDEIKKAQGVVKEVEIWDRYEQRCRISGVISQTKGEKKGHNKKIDGIGFREHSWGDRCTDRISCRSWITIQFRDMAMDLTYMEIDNTPYSSGFISKRTGNIPIIGVELELLCFNRDNSSLLSTEFSYTDAQDDRDLIVSKKLYSLAMDVPKSKNSKFLRMRAFSEFTIIGTNKKGIGMEEHYISIERLKKMD